jgi:hypothetical protein
MPPRDSSLLKDLRVLLGYLAVRDELESADVIIGFGSDCSEIAHHIAALYKKKFAPLVLFTGGRGRLTGNIQGTEAAFLQRIAIEDGVPEEAIVIEEESTNALENVQLGLGLLTKNGISIERVIATAQPPLQRRIWATIQKQFPLVEVINCPLSWEESLEHLEANEIIEKCIMAVGEVERLVRYSKEGDIERHEIPAAVRKAYDRIHIAVTRIDSYLDTTIKKTEPAIDP